MLGLRFFTRSSDNGIVLVSRHPKGSLTWYWSVSLKRLSEEQRNRIVVRDPRRTHQWHDYYRLPFGWRIIVSQQDYHKRRVVA